MSRRTAFFLAVAILVVGIFLLLCLGQVVGGLSVLADDGVPASHYLRNNAVSALVAAFVLAAIAGGQLILSIVVPTITVPKKS